MASNDPIDAPEDAATPPPRAARRRRFERTMLALIAVVVTGAGLHFARGLLIPIVVAVMLSLLFRPLVQILGRRLRLPEAIGAVIVVALALAGSGVLASYLYEPAAQLMRMGPGEVRQLERKLRELARPVQAIRGATDKVTKLAEAADPPEKRREVVMESGGSLKWVGVAQSAAASVVSCVILLYFLLASGDVFLRKLIRVIPGLRDRILAVEITRDIQAEIGRYFAATTLINIGLGVCTGLVMMALGMPSPGLIGAFAAVLNFVPYVGSLVALVGILLAAAVTFDTVWQIAIPPLAFLALSAIEGQFVQPLILGRSLALNPVVLFVWMMLWGWLWGIAGFLVAVPMLVALRICADRFESMSLLAEFIRR
jgi:predicted PurR-regulated permease PerM